MTIRDLIKYDLSIKNSVFDIKDCRYLSKRENEFPRIRFEKDKYEIELEDPIVIAWNSVMRDISRESGFSVARLWGKSIGSTSFTVKPFSLKK